MIDTLRVLSNTLPAHTLKIQEVRDGGYGVRPQEQRQHQQWQRVVDACAARFQFVKFSINVGMLIITAVYVF